KQLAETSFRTFITGGSEMIKHKIFFAIVFLCLGAIPALAQNASLVGTVRDPQQAVIPGVAVVLANADTGAEVTAQGNEMGNYEFPTVRPGNYSIKVNKPGFQPLTESIVLVVGQRARADITLQVGAVSSEVSVEAIATVVQTESSALGGVVDNKK